MTIPTLPTISRMPTVGMEGSRQPRVNEASFGDGYIQRSVDGINNLMESYDNIEWNKCTKADADTLDNFFFGLAGVSSFYWTPFGETPTSPVKRWVCQQWSRRKEVPSPDGYSYDTITASFKRDFGPAS